MKRIAFFSLVLSAFVLQPAAAQPIEAAQNLSPVLKLEIMSNCQDGAANFRIRNAGESWPKTAEFEIFGLGEDGNRRIAKRKLRLKEGQRASFKVKAERNKTGRVGIHIKPGWYERDFAYDATVDCR